MHRVVFRSAVGDLDQEPARLGDEERQRVMRGGEMRLDRVAQQAQPVLEIVLPHRLVPFEQVLAAPDVVDEDIEPPAFGLDARDECRDLGGNEVIRAHRDAFAARGRDELRRLLNRLRPVDLGFLRTRAAPGHVNRGAGGTQFHCDAASRAARAAGDERDFPCEPFHP
jgi:hypothetical protein